MHNILYNSELQSKVIIDTVDAGTCNMEFKFVRIPAVDAALNDSAARNIFSAEIVKKWKVNKEFTIETKKLLIKNWIMDYHVMPWLKSTTHKRRTWNCFSVFSLPQFMLRTLPHMFLNYTFTPEELRGVKGALVDDKLRLILGNSSVPPCHCFPPWIKRCKTFFTGEDKKHPDLDDFTPRVQVNLLKNYCGSVSWKCFHHVRSLFESFAHQENCAMDGAELLLQKTFNYIHNWQYSCGRVFTKKSLQFLKNSFYEFNENTQRARKLQFGPLNIITLADVYFSRVAVNKFDFCQGFVAEALRKLKKLLR